jgi:hypothetical protein
MLCKALTWDDTAGWHCVDGRHAHDANLVLYFGDRHTLERGGHYEGLRRQFAKADIAGCSTSGQIVNGDVSDNGVVGVAIRFDDTRTRLASVELPNPEASAACGKRLGEALAAPDLKSVFVLSDGVGTNASALIQGLVAVIGKAVPVTGGLAGDGDKFAKTLVGGNGAPQEKTAVAIGFYGQHFRLGHGSDGGWKTFGPPRRITRSTNNVLYELDDKPALDLYKRYLGEEADNLPGSALLFPLKIWDPKNPDQDVVRTIVGLNEADRSLIFAGNVPMGFEASLMRGSHENLVQGAENAARAAALDGTKGDQLSILISCVGRKLLMGQQSSDETEIVRDHLNPQGMQIGFYSYGEISPHSATGACELHNQTMTVTVMGEKA